MMLFTEVLDDPLRGWVNSYKPNTLEEAIMETQDMADMFPNNTLVKNFIPPKV
jgi:hypothetical protein